MPDQLIDLTSSDPALLAHPTIAWAAGVLTDSLGGRTGATRTVRLVDDGSDGYRAQEEADGLVVTGGPVGISHALTDLAQAVRFGTEPEAALTSLAGRAETPAVPVRSIARSFSSVDEDLPWFRDKAFWTEYLDWLALCRFSRFHLALGMQYNYGADPHGATDNYLCFAYPFLLDVDGWEVRAEGVDAAEQQANLEALQFIAAEAKRRGLWFQLGLWNHAYDYGRDSQHWYPIVGLTPETHADYSAAALAELLRRVPQIDGLTFRVHYEGGIHDEGHEIFWGKVFAGADSVGRPLEIDMHAKGVDQPLIDAVTRPNLHPVLSAKYWAEHMGLPYHQTSIRKREEAKPIPPGHEMKGITEFSRRFTRYGYGDFLAEDRQTDLIFRVWPGTQKLLLWGDPAIAAGYGRLSTFGGSLGVDVCEPLYFSGRKGSGGKGLRDPYVHPELTLDGQEWRKYKYTYLLWGRLLYNPDTDPQVWRRFLRAEYGEAADAVEGSLSPLGRILPLVTVVHGVGGSNNGNWPEMYINLPISQRTDPAHYAHDTESPAVWGTVSPFDPTLFYIINDYAADRVAGTVSGKYTPLEVATWLEDLVAQATPALDRLRATRATDPQLRRTIIDAEVQAALGTFFAGKFRAATAYALYGRTGDTALLTETLEHYRTAREAYARIPEIVDGIYRTDLRFGPEPFEHGHWRTRVPGIDADIANLETELAEAAGSGTGRALPAVAERPNKPGVEHAAPTCFVRGEPLELSLVVLPGTEISSVVLHYRHVDQSQPFQQLTLVADGDRFVGSIGGSYTASSYPLMYFFEVAYADGGSDIHPGLAADLSNQPYIFVPGTASRG